MIRYYVSALSVVAALSFFGCQKLSSNPESDIPQISAEIMPPQAFPGETGILDSGYYLGNKMYYNRIHGLNVFQGDVILADSLISSGPGLSKAASTSRTLQIWPRSTVYYSIDAAVQNQQLILNAITHYRNNTNLNFFLRTNQPNYIRFQVTSGTSSVTEGHGMKGGEQYIKLSNSSSTGTVIHEIGHALGLFHEQCRTDRGEYIIINWLNIGLNYWNQFQTFLDWGYKDGTNIGPFDFESIMLYGCYYYSVSEGGIAKDGTKPVMTKKDGSTWSENRNNLSSGDIVALNMLYPRTHPFPAGDPVTAAIGTEHHIVFRDGAGAIWDKLYRPGSWFLQQYNLGLYTSGPPAASDVAISVYKNEQHYTYRDNSGNIWDMYDAASRWYLQKINQGGKTSGNAAVGNPFVAATNLDQHHILYRDAAGKIWDSYYGGGTWYLQQINMSGGKTPSAPAAVGDPFLSVYSNAQHTVYRDGTGKIWDSWYSGSWNLQQINMSGGKTPSAPPAVGDPFIGVYSNQHHFLYRDASGRIWDSWYSGSWNLQQLNLGGSGSIGKTTAPAAVGDPVFSADNYGYQHNIYRAGNGAIWDCWYSKGGWQAQQINLGGKTSGPAAAGDPAVCLYNNSQQHITYRSSANDLWDCWYDGTWHLQQLNQFN